MDVGNKFYSILYKHYCRDQCVCWGGGGRRGGGALIRFDIYVIELVDLCILPPTYMM